LDNQPAGAYDESEGSTPVSLYHVEPCASLCNGLMANIQSPEGTEMPEAVAVTAALVVFTTTSSGTPTLVYVVAP
jgi:hypothetical protein